MAPTTDQLKAWAKAGWAMPDGSYYIKPGSVSDLNNAILAVGRGGANHDTIRRHIIQRAKTKDINRPDLIPDNWNADGSLKHSDIDEFLAHFGVKGMRWGVRRSKNTSATASKAPVRSSVDHTRSTRIKTKAKTHGGVHALSNKELQDLVTRMNLEKQYSTLETGPGSKADQGRKFVDRATKDGRLGINAWKTGKEAAKILAPILIAAGAAAAANKAGGGVKYYHPSNRLAITSG